MFIEGYGHEHDFGYNIADVITSFSTEVLTDSRGVMCQMMEQ